MGPPLRSAPASSPSDSPGATATPRADRTGTRSRARTSGRATSTPAGRTAVGGPPRRHDRAAARHQPGVPRGGGLDRRLLRAARLPGPPPGVRRAGRACRGGCRCRQGSRSTSWRRRDGFDPAAPHLVVGAHLDTVPQAPGAEDNASGVGVVLAAAAAAAEGRTRLPVVWVAFGAEEPRGPTDDDHHYGSRAYVAAMAPAERRALRGMVSLDRVGVGGTVPVGSAEDSDPVQQSLLDAARRAGVPAYGDRFQRSSDHWSFVRAGLPGCPPRLHVVRRLPLAGRPAVRRRAGPARARRTAAAGVAGAYALTQRRANRPRLCSRTSARIAAAAAPGDRPRREVGAHPVGPELDVDQPVAPEGRGRG